MATPGFNGQPVGIRCAQRDALSKGVFGWLRCKFANTLDRVTAFTGSEYSGAATGFLNGAFIGTALAVVGGVAAASYGAWGALGLFPASIPLLGGLSILPALMIVGIVGLAIYKGYNAYKQAQNSDFRESGATIADQIAGIDTPTRERQLVQGMEAVMAAGAAMSMTPEQRASARQATSQSLGAGNGGNRPGDYWLRLQEAQRAQALAQQGRTA